MFLLYMILFKSSLALHERHSWCVFAQSSEINLKMSLLPYLHFQGYFLYLQNSDLFFSPPNFWRDYCFPKKLLSCSLLWKNEIQKEDLFSGNCWLPSKMLASFVQLSSWLLLTMTSEWTGKFQISGRVFRIGNELDNQFWVTNVVAFEPPVALIQHQDEMPASKNNCLLLGVFRVVFK